MTVNELYVALGKLIADGKENYDVDYVNDEYGWQPIDKIEIDEDTKLIAITDETYVRLV